MRACLVFSHRAAPKLARMEATEGILRSPTDVKGRDKDKVGWACAGAGGLWRRWKPSFFASPLCFWHMFSILCLLLQAGFLFLYFLVQMVENSLCQQFQCLNVFFIQDSRQIEQEPLTSKSRFLGKGTWPTWCPVQLLILLLTVVVWGRVSYPIMAARGSLQ